MVILRSTETPEHVLSDFFSLVEEEFTNAERFLDDDDLKVYRRYYPGVARSLKDQEYRSRFRRQFIRGPLNPLVQDLLRNRESKLALLDAGCGLGMESILFSTLGAEVTGIDLRADRVAVAGKRKRWFGEKLDTNLAVSFSQGSVFALGDRPIFDRIWVCEAISHIDPAEDFLRMTYNLLKPGGSITISDANGYFVPNQVQRYRQRGLDIHTTFKTEDGQVVPYAMERVFSPGQICSILRKSGFSIQHLETHLVGRNKVGDAFFSRAFRSLERLPVLGTLLGRSYVVMGRKPCGD